MAKVTLTIDGKYLGEYPLVKARTSIGRRDRNDICLDNLAVSGEHASIVKMGPDHYVEDLDSTNGLLVNGVSTKKQLLQQDDVITIGGHYALTYSNGAEQPKSNDADDTHGFEKTMMVSPSFMKANALRASAAVNVVPPKAEKPQPEPDSSQSGNANDLLTKPDGLLACIQVLNGSNSGRELQLNKTLTTLGKTGVQVAAITRRANGYFITHVEGNVRPLVNGVAAGVKSQELHDHDVIELAGIKMEFYLVKA